MAAACARGFSTHGGGRALVHSAIASWLSAWTNFGQGMPALARAHAHRQLVAKRARGRFAHARHVQVLAQHRGELDVEVVERDDPIDTLGPRQEGGALADVLERHVAAHVEELVDRLAGPVRVAQLLFGQEQDTAPLPPAFAEEVVALAIGGDAEEREWAWPAHREYISRRMVNCVGCPLFAVLDSHTPAVADSQQRQASWLLRARARSRTVTGVTTRP